MRRVASLPRWAPNLALGIVLFVLARSVQQAGHGWGDDFALYINQARGLVEGTAGEVIAQNRFAMDNSAFPAFTPVAYPWGTSLLLLPVVMWAGIDYGLLKLVPTLAFVGAVLAYQRLAQDRLGWLAAAAMTLTLAFNPWFIWATDAVLSDLPFMALVFAAIISIERAARRGTLFAARHSDPVLVGALVAAAFHVRREALGILLAVAVAQIATWWARRRPAGSPDDEAPVTDPDLAGHGWRKWSRPWVTFLLVAGVGHLLFPAPVRGNVDVAGDPGWSQVTTNLAWYRQPFAELAGLKRIGDEPVTALGVHWLGSAMVWVLLGAALIGAGWSVVGAARGRGVGDLVVAATVLGVGLIVMMTPYHYQRYLYTLVPLVLLLAISGVTRLATAALRKRAPGWIPQAAAIAVLLPTLALHVDVTIDSLRFHTSYRYVHRGPEDAPTEELWAAVREYTDGRDVVVFFQPRAMNLYTRRLSIVGNDERMMVDRGDWYAMERDSDYLQTPLTDERAAALGFVAVWANERYVLWDIPPRPRPRPGEVVVGP